MDQYAYEASDKTGRVIKGLVEADSIDAAEDIIRYNKLIILEIKPYLTPNEKLTSFFSSIFKKVGARDKAVFAKQLSTMINAGLPLMEALKSLTKQTPNRNLVTVIYKVIALIEKGRSFSFALSQFPSVFPPVFVSMVRSGEASGKMDKVLGDLADQLEGDYAMRSKIKSAMVYPIFIMSVMGGVGVFALVFILPKLETTFTESGGKLPVTTMLLIQLSHFMINFWYIVLLVIVGGIVFLKYFSAIEAGQRTMGWLALKVPIFKKVNLGMYIAIFARTLGLLVVGGVPIIRSLSMVSMSIGNVLIERELKQAILEVEKGVPLSVPISKSKYFPPLVSSMISVGEQTGKLDAILLNLATIYENETNDLIKGLTALLEPAIMLIIGIGVAFLVISIILPIFQLSSVF